MLHPGQFRELVIRPTLEKLGMAGPAAEQLMLGTALAESGLRYLHQMGGPALGLMQVEPATHADIWRYLRGKPRLREKMSRFAIGGAQPPDSHLVTNLAYAVAVARLVYWRRPGPLPADGDLLGLARYWKQHYNTRLGSGTPEHFLSAAATHLT